MLCIRSTRCKACVVDPGGPGAPRTEKTTTQDCIMLSPHNQVYHEPQTGQVPCYYHPMQLNEVSRLKSINYSSCWCWGVWRHVWMNSNSILIKPPILNACFNNNYSWCHYTCQRTRVNQSRRGRHSSPLQTQLPLPPNRTMTALQYTRDPPGLKWGWSGKKYINRENKNWTLE